MRFLLDTHVFIWFVSGDKRLKKDIISKIAHAADVYISSASIWEAVIKIKLGKLEADPKELIKAIQDSDFSELPVTSEHAIAVSQLPDLHRDPFDRILIAQAIYEPLIFLTADHVLHQYSSQIQII